MSNVETKQSNLCNHCPNFYYNQSNTQRIKKITKELQTAVQFDSLLKNNEHSNQYIYDTFSQSSRFEDNHNSVQWHLHNTLSSSHSNLNSEQNESFNNNLVLTLPKLDPYSLSDENEENRRTWIISDSQESGSSQLQSSAQQENRIEPNFKDQVNDSNEMNKKSLLPPTPNVQLFSKLPSFLEPRFLSNSCNELYCDNDTYGYENLSLYNRNVIMSYSWNIIGNHCNDSLPSSQPIIPFYCWEDQVVSSPIHLTNDCPEQASARKCALQSGMLVTNFTSKKAKTFVENQGTSFSPNLTLLTIGSNGSNINEYDINDACHIQPKIDLSDVVLETPEPPVDPNDPRLDAQPRRQKLKYSGDMYTPQWVRYSGHTKEGYCDNCKPGKWLQLKNSAYWYHKQFFHGISSVSGKMVVSPIKTRKSDADDCTEGLCHQCRQWVPIATTKRKGSILWFRNVMFMLNPKAMYTIKDVKI
ncbi:hypothetical protein RclHR1_19150005 [Rhizophagus clarus]|nr:hypothetical protein RclHR1_19150005 [Rhizophagus clarus]